MKEQCRVIETETGFRVQFKKWVWSKPFLGQFRSAIEAENFCRGEWPNAEFVGIVKGEKQ